MYNQALLEQFLIAGDTPVNRWDAHNVCLVHREVLSQISYKIADEVKSHKPDFICAIRGTGVPPALFIFRRTGIPLLWFRDASIDELVPRYVKVSDKALVLVDTHMITGLNIVRHAQLVQRLGAKISLVLILLDLDEYRTDVQRRLLLDLGIPIHPIWTWSEVKSVIESSKDPLIRRIYEKDEELRENYWR